MIGRKSVIGIAVLAALAICALSAANASAAEQTTAYTCSPTAPVKEFSRAHCAKADKPGTAFGHEAIPPGEFTNIEITSANTAGGTTASTPTKLEGTIVGVETAIQCSTASGTGSLSNQEEGGNMRAEISGKLTYTGCSVTKPAGKGCEVKEGKIATEELLVTTKGQATGSWKWQVKFSTKWGDITIQHCSVSALNNTFPLTGSLVAGTDGATTNKVHNFITAQETLIFGGNEAGLEGSYTVKMAGGGNGIVLT